MKFKDSKSRYNPYSVEWANGAGNCISVVSYLGIVPTYTAILLILLMLLSCNRYDPLSRDVYCFKVTIVKRVSRIRVKSIILFVVGCPYVKIFNNYLSLFNIL